MTTLEEINNRLFGNASPNVQHISHEMIKDVWKQAFERDALLDQAVRNVTEPWAREYMLMRGLDFCGSVTLARIRAEYARLNGEHNA